MFNNNNFDLILNSFDNNNNSHSYIFYTNDFFACQNDVNELIRRLYNVDNLNLISSDFVIVKKSENKSILKEDIVKIKDMFQNTSYLNKKRIYLIEEAHKLNSSSANIILKFLEEPLDGVIAFFITTNLDAVLNTIKSRCQIINCFYNLNNHENLINNNDTLLNLISNNNNYINLWTAKKSLEKYDRNLLIELFSETLYNYYNNINNVVDLNIIKLLNRSITMLNNNVNIDYVLDYLFLKGSD